METLLPKNPNRITGFIQLHTISHSLSSVSLNHHTASKAVIGPKIFSSKGFSCNNCEDTWNILLSLSNHSVLMWVLDWEGLWLVEMDKQLKGEVSDCLIYVPNSLPRVTGTRQFLGAVKLITRSKPAGVSLPAAQSKHWYASQTLLSHTSLCVLEMLYSLQLPCLLSNLEAFIYSKKFCVALQGESLLLIQSPSLQVPHGRPGSQHRCTIVKQLVAFQ